MDYNQNQHPDRDENQNQNQNQNHTRDQIQNQNHNRKKRNENSNSVTAPSNEDDLKNTKRKHKRKCSHPKNSELRSPQVKRVRNKNVKHGKNKNGKISVATLKRGIMNRICQLGAQIPELALLEGQSKFKKTDWFRVAAVIISRFEKPRQAIPANRLLPQDENKTLEHNLYQRNDCKNDNGWSECYDQYVKRKCQIPLHGVTFAMVFSFLAHETSSTSQLHELIAKPSCRQLALLSLVCREFYVAVHAFFDQHILQWWISDVNIPVPFVAGKLCVRLDHEKILWPLGFTTSNSLSTKTHTRIASENRIVQASRDETKPMESISPIPNDTTIPASLSPSVAHPTTIMDVDTKTTTHSNGTKDKSETKTITRDVKSTNTKTDKLDLKNRKHLFREIMKQFLAFKTVLGKDILLPGRILRILQIHRSHLCAISNYSKLFSTSEIANFALLRFGTITRCYQHVLHQFRASNNAYKKPPKRTSCVVVAGGSLYYRPIRYITKRKPRMPPEWNIFPWTSTYNCDCQSSLCCGDTPLTPDV